MVRPEPTWPNASHSTGIEGVWEARSYLMHRSKKHAEAHLPLTWCYRRAQTAHVMAGARSTGCDVSAKWGTWQRRDRRAGIASL